MSYNQQDSSYYSNNYNNINHPQSYTNNNNQQYIKKERGLNIYQIPIFSIYNPKSAAVNFYITGKTADLGVSIAPAIPNNPAINLKGPVPAGVKVYDYNKTVFSNFSDVDTVDFVNFLKSKFVNDLTSFKKVIVDTNNMITELKANINNIIGPEFFQQFQQYPQFGQQMYSILSQIVNKLDALKVQGDTMLAENNARKNNNENQFSLYRKSNSFDKAWNFNYDPSSHMLHINVLSGAGMKEKYNISLSAKMVARLISIIESYTSNYCMISMICNLNSELSKTLAFNKILAPNKEESEFYV